MFELSDDRNRSESNSGLLDYKFTDPSGVIEIANTQQIDLGSDAETELGTWVFGDYSSNILEYWIEDSQSNLLKVEIDTIDWTGWHIKSVKLSELGGSAPYKFNSIVIKKSESGSSEGSLYFDDVQVDFVTPVNGIENNMPAEFSLQQNYPNPFNPTTTIEYSLPVSSKKYIVGSKQNQDASIEHPESNIQHQATVSLKVYDMLGREVATLVNDRQQPGHYTVEFDASSLSSGVYFYKLAAGSFISTKKMILLK
jgi:hypothetical protein